MLDVRGRACCGATSTCPCSYQLSPCENHCARTADSTTTAIIMCCVFFQKLRYTYWDIHFSFEYSSTVDFGRRPINVNCVFHQSNRLITKRVTLTQRFNGKLPLGCGYPSLSDRVIYFICQKRSIPNPSAVCVRSVERLSTLNSRTVAKQRTVDSMA